MPHIVSRPAKTPPHRTAASRQFPQLPQVNCLRDCVRGAQDGSSVIVHAPAWANRHFRLPHAFCMFCTRKGGAVAPDSRQASTFWSFGNQDGQSLTKTRTVVAHVPPKRAARVGR